MKRYEKHALLRFFILFSSAFSLMFILLGGFYFYKEHERLRKELEIEITMEFATCMQLEMGDCHKYNNEEPNLEKLYREILFIFLIVLIIFIPISLYLSFYALRPVRQASTMIDNFIANIVHDINTPIATIMLNTKSLIRKAKNEPKNLKRILSSAEQLTDMQHDLLALADENMQIEKELVELKELILDVINGFELQYDSQPFIVELIPQEVSVNRVDLRRIIQNLISNSIKYNQNENPIKIYSKENILSIEDQGKGMECPEKVFEKNYREDYTIQGNGLGLASVMAMLKRNQIEITVQSKINIGTHITLNFC